MKYWREETYACHGSIREKEMPSTVRKYCLEKTKMMFPQGVSCVQYYGFLKGSEKRATFAVSLVSDSLKG